MPTPLAVGTKQTLQSVPKFYKHLFSKDYLWMARTNSPNGGKSRAKFVAGRLLVSIGMTAGAPVVLPIAVARGIYKNTKDERERQAPTPPPPPPVVAAPAVTAPQQPSSLEECARKLFLSRGVSEEGAAAMAAFVYREVPLPGLECRDVQILHQIHDEDLQRSPQEMFKDDEIFSPLES